jgi:apolipoprotein N-acyltransferase
MRSRLGRLTLVPPPDPRALLGLRAAAAVLAGVALGLTWQPFGWWPLLVVSIPAFTLAVRNQPGRRAFGLGYLFGLGMLTVAVSWLHVLGLWIAALLIVFEALFFGVLGVLLSLLSRLRWWPVASAAAWVLVEYAYGRVPFGGFGWIRLAYAAVDTPLSGFLPVIGVAGLSFVVALLTQVIAWCAYAIWSMRGVPADRRPGRRRFVLPVTALIVILAVPLGLRFYQVEPGQTAAGQVNVGIVQGNIPGRGIEAMGRARSVTNNHLSETVNLMTKVRLGQERQPDFLLWPENSTDIDPTVDPVTRLIVEAAAQVADRPILVGAVMQGPGEGERQTSALWWQPGRGPQARYDKQNLVPFGEWIPFRDQLKPLVPILDRVGAQSVPGTKPGVLTVDLDDRVIRLGDVICFELAYDKTVYAAVRGGAQVMLVQSNNATYGGTGQIEQQFAITRARAMEARREIAVATTNSVSGLIDRNGRVVYRTAEFTADSRVVAMPLRSAITPALFVAPWLERGLAVFAVVAAAIAWVVSKRTDRPTGRPVETSTSQPSSVVDAAT